jgi:hypothetical protein
VATKVVDRLNALSGRGDLHFNVAFCVRFSLIVRSLIDGNCFGTKTGLIKLRGLG